MRGCKIFQFMVLIVVFIGSPAYADKKAEGGIALEETPVFLRSDSLEAAASLKKGQPVAAIRSVTLKLLGSGQYIFDEKNGRVQIYYFPGEDTARGKFYNGWVDPTKLAKFYYDCSCGVKRDDCDPIETRGFRFSFTWNSCFNEAWERKTSEISAKSPDAQASVDKKESVEERLKKLDELLKNGLITKDEYEKKRATVLESL